MTLDRKAFGAQAEKAAADELERRGFKILERNYRTSLGEIDLIAEKKGLLVFVEVKAGRADDAFHPSQHLDFRKKNKLLQLGRAYLSRFSAPRDARFDLMTVVDRNGTLEVDHFEDVVEDAPL